MSNFKKDILHENEDKSDVRLNRFLSDAGFCSRREADRLIEAGRVTVDGTKAELGTRVRPIPPGFTPSDVWTRIRRD